MPGIPVIRKTVFRHDKDFSYLLLDNWCKGIVVADIIHLLFGVDINGREQIISISQSVQNFLLHDGSAFGTKSFQDRSILTQSCVYLKDWLFQYVLIFIVSYIAALVRAIFFICSAD